MEIKVQTKVGNTSYQFVIDDKTEMDTIHKAAVLGNMPSYCNLCKNNEHFALDSNKDKEGNTYVNIVCKKCFAKAKLGQYKTGGYFWRQFEKYEGKTKTNKPNTSYNNDQEASMDIGF